MPNNFIQFEIIKRQSSRLITLLEISQEPPFAKKRCSFSFGHRQYWQSIVYFQKKNERLETAASYFDDFVRAYPESEFLDQSISIMNDIEKEITTFAAN